MNSDACGRKGAKSRPPARASASAASGSRIDSASPRYRSNICVINRQSRSTRTGICLASRTSMF
jgi:hypothetical protein